MAKNSSEEIATLTETLKQTLNQAKAPVPLASEIKGLSRDQIAEKTASTKQAYIKEATEVYQTSYDEKYAEIIKIPAMLGYFKNYSPDQVKVEIEKRAQIAGLKAGIEAVTKFIDSGEKPALKSATPEQPTAQVTEPKPAVAKISSSETHANFFNQPPPLPTQSKTKESAPPLPPREPPPLLSRVKALGEKGAYEELRDKKQQAEAAAKAEKDAMPPLVSTFSKKR